jgi:acetoin utilization deacetylase AcuC-like enzyme
VVLVVNGPYDDSEHAEDLHPERPARTEAVRSGIADLHLGSDLVLVPTRAASRADLLLVHDGSYLDELAAFCYGGGGEIDQDTYATFNSWPIAQNAAGAGLAVIEELRHREEGVGFVVARPPGHHALAGRAMGFCLLNNVAIAAAALRAMGERVLILDWDVHHGNGTQQIFWDTSDVLYVSTHQWPFYPGSGSPAEVGGESAIDRTVNIPLPSGTAGGILLQALEEIATPVIEEFRPTWVLVSAGFDAHRADPLAELALTSGDFARLARLAASFAPRSGRLALFLEGGYELHALRTSVAATLAAVLGAPYEAEPRSEPDESEGNKLIELVHGQRRTAIEILRLNEVNEERR